MNTMLVNLYGFDITVATGLHTSDYLFNGVNDRSWKPELFAVFDRFLQPGDCVIDIGAYVGATAMYAALKGCEVWAFEPDTVAREYLLRNLDLNPELREAVHVSDCAIATADDRDGCTPFGARGTWGNSVGGLTWANREGAVTGRVKTLTLATVIKEYSIPALDFIKVNVHGTESSLLEAGRAVLELYLPTVHVYVRPQSCGDAPRDIRLLERALDMYSVYTETGEGIPKGQLALPKRINAGDFKILATVGPYFRATEKP